MNVRLLPLALLLSISSGIVWCENFAIDQMPVGAEVTVPPTAITVIPLGSRVKLTSTDNPQTIRIVPIGNGSTFASPIQVAIFDTHQDRVKYVRVTPNTPFLYTFKGLSTISLQSTAYGTAQLSSGVRMQVESDKAVTVAR